MGYNKEVRELFAQLHPEMLGWAKAHYDSFSDEDKQFWASIFPELQESEDERIRKELVHFIQGEIEYMEKGGGTYLTRQNSPRLNFFYDALEWLEKHRYLFAPKDWDEGDDRMNHPLYKEGFEVGRKVGRVEAEKKPVEWNEEDEDRVLKGIIGVLEHDQSYGVSRKEMYDYLMSHRAPHWKPSEEQMKSLNWWKNYSEFLSSLYDDLKKL